MLYLILFAHDLIGNSVFLLCLTAFIVSGIVKTDEAHETAAENVSGEDKSIESISSVVNTVSLEML